MSNKFELVKGDTAKRVYLTCVDENNEPIDVSEADVRIKFRIGKGEWKIRVMQKPNGGDDGVVAYRFIEADDLDDSGTLQFEIEIENLNGTIASNDDWQYIEVRPEAE